MQTVTVLSLHTNTPREMQTKVTPVHRITLRVATILRNVAASARLRLGQVLVLAIAAGPLIVPDVEDGSCLRRRLGREGVGVHLDARRPLLLADDLADLLFGWGCDLGRGCCEGHVWVF